MDSNRHLALMSLGLNHCSKSLIVTSSGIVCSKTIFFFANWEEEVSCCMKSCVSGGTCGHKHLPESPAAAVSQEGCEVRSWKLQLSLCLPHPPCNCGGGRAKTQLVVWGHPMTNRLSVAHWVIDGQTRSYPHNRVDSPTVTFPHASEARLTTDVPDLRAEEESLNAQAIQRWAQNWARVPIVSMWFAALSFIMLTYLYCHVAFGDLPHVETNRGNHVFTELARLLQEDTGWRGNWWKCAFEKKQKKNKTETQCWERTACLRLWSDLQDAKRISCVCLKLYLTE